jgi:hypothetical protein
MKENIYNKNKKLSTLIQLRKIHEFYQANPRCTIKQCQTFTPYSNTAIEKYSAIRTECLFAICSVIDLRYGCVWCDSDNHTKDILSVV